jgi:hypothetical protein
MRRALRPEATPTQRWVDDLIVVYDPGGYRSLVNLAGVGM